MPRLIIALLLAPMALLADLGTPCASGTLLDYINLGSGGCAIGGNLFFDFFELTLPNGAIPIDSAAILVTPGGSAASQTLTFTLNQSAGAGQFFDSRFAYSVQIPSGKPPLTEFGLAMSGAQATGDGAVTAVANICIGEAFFFDFCLQQSATVIVAATQFFTLDSATTALDPPFTIGILNDIGIDGGLSGSATLATVTNTIVPTPEPAAAYLLMTCIAAAAWLRRRRRQQHG